MPTSWTPSVFPADPYWNVPLWAEIVMITPDNEAHVVVYRVTWSRDRSTGNTTISRRLAGSGWDMVLDKLWPMQGPNTPHHEVVYYLSHMCTFGVVYLPHLGCPIA